MVKKYDRLLSSLRAAVGDEHVHVGDPVDRSTIVALGTKLGVKLPKDYVDFIAAYGYLLAGETGQIRVFGIPAKTRKRLPYPVDLEKATKALHAELRATIKSVPASAAQLTPGLATIPIIGWAEDFPSHQVHVFDAAGKLRWFLVKEWALDPPTGTFASYLEELVERAVEDRAEERAAEEKSAKAAANPYAGDYTHVLSVRPNVLAAIRRYPRIVGVLGTIKTRAELVGEVLKDPKGWALGKDDVKQLRAFAADPSIAKVATFASEVDDIGNGTFTGPMLRRLLCGSAVRPAQPTTELEIAFNGAELVPTGLARRPFARLVPPDRVKAIMPALKKAKQQLVKAFDGKLLRKDGLYDGDDDDAALKEQLVYSLDALVAEYAAAAKAGKGVLVRDRFTG